MNTLYGRKSKLVITTWSGREIEVSSELRYTFQIRKSFSQIYQFANITIYNLSADTETDIFQNAKTVTLEGGYEHGYYGTLFIGTVRQPIRGKENGTDYFLTLSCLAGDQELNLGFTAITIEGGQDIQTLMNTMTRSSSVPFDPRISETINQGLSIRGKTFFGAPSDYLRSVAIDNNALFYWDSNGAYIDPIISDPPSIIPELNAETGMIGMPRQVDKGIQIRTLLRPDLNLNGWVRLNNQDIITEEIQIGKLPILLDQDGLYRIIDMTITGDTRGNDWYCDLNCLNQGNGLPAILATRNQRAT